MTDDLGTLYTVWQNDDGRTNLDPECAALIDRAMKLWTTEKRDTWIAVQSPDGAERNILASSINSSLLSTPEQRRLAAIRDKAIDDEYKANRREAGFLESDS